MTFRDFTCNAGATWCNAAICLLWSDIILTHVINYEDEWLPPACQHGLLSRRGMGHPGHAGQSYYGSPAGSRSSGPLIDPSPAEQTAALDVTRFPHPGPLALARTQTDSLMGHQTKLPVWQASTKVMNDKYHSPSAAPPAALLSLWLRVTQSAWEDRVCNVQCCLVQAWMHS